MELHLFSVGDADQDLRPVMEACKQLLEGRTEVSVAFLPLGSLGVNRLLEETRKLFHHLAEIELVDAETMELPAMEMILRKAALAYIPDGNAYLLNHRLNLSRLAPYLQKKIQSGLPVVAVGAGAVACGPNILTADALNLVPTSYFNGLAVTPFNLHVHYVDDIERDAWLADYHTFHDNPVILLEDGASLRMHGKTTSLEAGAGWCLRPRQEKQRLTIGEPIPVN